MKIAILLIIISIVIFSIWYAKKKGVPVKVPLNATKIQTQLDSPIDFGYKSRWIAVKGNNKSKIAEILGFKSLVEANWASGMTKANEEGIYISPEIGEWTLVCGVGVPFGDHVDSINQLEKRLNQLSVEFGEAQYFGTHRIVEFHNWMKSVDGSMKRIYAYLGESMENIKIEGDKTAPEFSLNLFNSFSEESKNDEYYERDDIVFPDEELVMQIAESWSINPVTLSTRTDIKEGLGRYAK